MPEHPSVAVIGAGGHTGRFVVAELRRRGLRPVLAGREPSRWTPELRASDEARVVDLEVPSSLDQALVGTAAVVNCAGPFLDTAGPVIAAAVRAGVHYLDVTAEQASAQTTLEGAAAAARAAGVALIPAMGFFGGLGDLLAQATLGDWNGAESVELAIAIDRWWPTEGTRRTGRRNTVPRQVLRDGALVPLEAEPATRDWSFPAPAGRLQVQELPFSETLLIQRSARVRTLRNFFSLAPLADLRDPNTPPPTAVDAFGRSAQQFVVEAVARRGTETRRGRVSGRDIYAITAPLVVEAAVRLLRAEPRPAGAFSPAQIFPAGEFLQSLAPDQLEFELLA